MWWRGPSAESKTNALDSMLVTSPCQHGVGVFWIGYDAVLGAREQFVHHGFGEALLDSIVGGVIRECFHARWSGPLGGSEFGMLRRRDSRNR